MQNMWVTFVNAKATHILFCNITNIYAIFNDQSFKDTLTNDVVSFEQLGQGQYKRHIWSQQTKKKCNGRTALERK